MYGKIDESGEVTDFSDGKYNGDEWMMMEGKGNVYVPIYLYFTVVAFYTKTDT